MTKLMLYPLEVDYKVVGGRPRFYIFGRTQKGEQICLIDETFRPFFYILINHENFDSFVKKIKSIRVRRRDREFGLVDVEIVRKKYKGSEQKAIKVYTKLPKDIDALVDKIKDLPDVAEILETDILLIRRYLIENHITPWVLSEAEGEEINIDLNIKTYRVASISQNSTDVYENPKILAFDIETYNPTGKEFDMNKNPILMISFYSEGLKKVITHKRIKTDKEYITFVDGEMELLEQAKKVIQDFQPDILAGYYSDNFDLPYLMYRAKKYRIDFDIGLDKSEPMVRSGSETSIKIRGISHVDLYKVFIGIMERRLNLTSYSLDSVSEALLGEHKDNVDIENLWKSWDNESDEELEKFAVYNLRDSELTYKLCLEAKDVLQELVRMVGVPMFNSARMAFSQLVEWYLIRRSAEFDEIVPNKPNHKELVERMTAKPIKGGFVFTPEPGVYENLAVLDFRSLYPSIIVTHNLSPSTLNCQCCKYSPKYVPSQDKTWFCSKKDGFIPKVIRDILDRRARIKDMIWDKKEEESGVLHSRELVLKTLANAFYGYLSFFLSRWYSRESASAVTAYGRKYITEVINWSSSEGFELVYSDTDSVFLILHDKEVSDVIKFRDKVNDFLPGLVELEYEGHYKKALFVPTKGGTGAKKKYALMDSRRHITVKGFEFIRRNIPKIAREVQFEIIRLILRDEKDKIKDFLDKMINRVEDHKIPKDKLIISTQLSKKIEEYEMIMPHVAVAKRMIEQGHDVSEGDIIDYVICEGEGKLKDKARVPTECDSNEYDAEYYVNNQIIPAVEGLLSLVKIDPARFNYDGKDQEKLDRFI